MDIAWVWKLLNSNTSVLAAALISTTISAIVAYVFRVREHRLKLMADYEHEQRKALRVIIGRTHGRLLLAGNSLNYRFWNLYANSEKSWLSVEDYTQSESYYLHSFVSRFMSVFVLVREFERQALYVDSRIATRNDMLFLKYVAALHWCMTDVALFEGANYDASSPTDHFFSDSLRTYCDICVDENGQLLKIEDLLNLAKNNPGIESVFIFFKGLSATEGRLRWDRLVCLHLLIATFVNSIGYPEHKTSRAKILKVATQVRNRVVLKNLAEWLPRHGFGRDSDSRMLISVCKKLNKCS